MSKDNNPISPHIFKVITIMYKAPDKSIFDERDFWKSIVALEQQNGFLNRFVTIIGHEFEGVKDHRVMIEGINNGSGFHVVLKNGVEF